MIKKEVKPEVKVLDHKIKANNDDFPKTAQHFTKIKAKLMKYGKIKD
jgi:hypothetical protein